MFLKLFLSRHFSPEASIIVPRPHLQSRSELLKERAVEALVRSNDRCQRTVPSGYMVLVFRLSLCAALIVDQVPDLSCSGPLGQAIR